MNFVFDRQELGRPYPNLAPAMDARNGYHGMGDSYPFIVPVRLLYFAQDHGYPINISYIDQPIPNNAWYPVGIGWFDFSQDYFARMSQQVQELLRQRRMRVLFYYHEGDSPYHEKTRLDELCHQNNLPVDCYRFVSGNTAARKIDNFVYFADHELFYWRSSVIWNHQHQPGCTIHQRQRRRDFTALSRVHKWWRATIMCYLNQQALLDNSYWSYHLVDIGDQWQDNPIQISQFDNLDQSIQQFVKQAPYACDDFDSEQQNSHWLFVPDHYSDSYCNLVLETFFDADGSDGTFISEKVFKPIRHGQPFVVFGTANTLAVLRDLGYRTYDHLIDNGYDSEINNTERFRMIVDAVKKLKQQDLHAWFDQCVADARYNQDLFVANKRCRLEQLATDLDTV